MNVPLWRKYFYMENHRVQNKDLYKGLSVLFVDDDREFLNSLKRVLIDEEFTGIYAQGGKDSLEILKMNDVNVIVADMKMPEMDGLTLLRKVKSECPDVVRVVLTGITKPVEILESINSGEVFRYIVKPLQSAKNFISYIYEALDYYNMRMMERKLIESEERFRAIFETTDDCILILDSDYNILYINQSAKKYIDIKCNKFGIKNINEFAEIYPNYKKLWMQRINNVIEARSRMSFEDTFPIKDWMIYCESELSPIKNVEGETVAIGIVYRDLTEIKKLQKKLIRSEKLIAAGKMAAGFANEIGNRLAAVSSSAQLCLSYLNPSQKIREHLLVIERNLDSAGEILHKLVNLSNNKPNELMSVNLNNLIKSTISQVKNIIQKNNIIINSNLDDKLPNIMVNELRINELLINLLLNAVDSLGTEGEVNIFTKFLDSDNMIVTEVVDNGSGISEDNIDTVFDPFFTSKESAEGLGLAICQQIVNEHNGSISVKNNSVKGCTFKFFLPVNFHTHEELNVEK